MHDFVTFLEDLVHFSLYKGWNCPFFVGGHYKVTVTRYVVLVETLFIIIERYVKLYIFDHVEIVHVRAMAI